MRFTYCRHLCPRLSVSGRLHHCDIITRQRLMTKNNGLVGKGKSRLLALVFLLISTPLYELLDYE
jgi:hypothetical protein